MSGGGWANNFAVTHDGWQESPWGYALVPTGHSLRQGAARLPYSFSFLPISSDSGRGGLPGPSWPMDDRVVTITGTHSGSAGSRAPQARVSRQMVLQGANLVNPTFTGRWGTLHPEEDSRLTPDEQKAATNKLKKEVYNPTPKRSSSRVSLYYRDQARNGASTATRIGQDDEDDGGKSCTICLEDFEPKEEVRVTPCNHMFHEDCIVPWLKSHGQCPVCRSMLYDQVTRNRSLYSNNSTARTLGSDGMRVEEIASMIRSVEEAIRAGRLGH